MDYIDSNGVRHKQSSAVDIAVFVIAAVAGLYLLPGIIVTECVALALSLPAPLHHPWYSAVAVSLALHVVLSLVRKGFWRGLFAHVGLSVLFLIIAATAAFAMDAIWPGILFRAVLTDYP